MRQTSLQIIVHLVFDMQDCGRYANSLTTVSYANDGNKKSPRLQPPSRQMEAGGSV
nr:MAG TPA: hypothetical protein [Caudoviricetes sp.]